MTRPFARLVAVLLFSFYALIAVAQPVGISPSPATEKKAPKPYKILTVGKQITIKTTKPMKKVMVWTASGHRIVEQQDVNSSTFNFRISVNEKVFFMMIHLSDGKVYSEKLGL